VTLSWRYAAASDVGLLRDGNEDSAFAGKRLLAVADGMGGHAAGEVASAAVIAALEQLDELGVDAGDPQEALREAVEEANANLRLMVAADNELQGMGTTITAVLSDGEHTWLAHIGDSRAYLLRGGELRQLTRDHTYVQQLVDEGRIAPEDASTHPQRNFITRALDGRAQIEVDLDRIDLRPGDRLLLCSDGLSGVVTDESMAEVLRTSSPDEAVQRLIDLALRGGGPDNITCIVAEAVESAATEGAVVAGAAGDGAANAAPALRNADSPAARAATLRRGAAPAAHEDGPDPRDRARRLRRRRALVVGGAVLALLGLGATAGWAWTQRQYYVGVAGGNVAVYKGVEGTLAGIELSKVDHTAPVAVASLPAFERKQVENGIHAGGRSEADRIVERLTLAALPPCPDPTTAPTATPAATPPGPPSGTPRPSAAPSARPSAAPGPTSPPATPSGTGSPSATPTPSPSPCPGRTVLP
jgi:protein phosphatase